MLEIKEQVQGDWGRGTEPGRLRTQATSMLRTETKTTERRRRHFKSYPELLLKIRHVIAHNFPPGKMFIGEKERVGRNLHPSKTRPYSRQNRSPHFHATLTCLENVTEVVRRPLFIGLSVFLGWARVSSYIFWRSGPCPRYHWQIHFPIRLVPFSFC